MTIIHQKNPIGNDPGHLLRSEKRINEQLRGEELLQFLRDEVNEGKVYRVPTFKTPSSPEEARKIEINALTIKYEKVHGKGSLVEALKEKFPEKYAAKSKGASFSERASESRELRGDSGRGSK